MTIAGGIISLIPGGQPFGIPLLISGALGTLGSLIAPRPAGSQGWEDSQTYGFDRAVNPSFEGMPKFIVYGEERITPSLISAVTEQSGNKQYAKLLFYCGDGGSRGIESISDIEINEESLDSYKKIETATRLGTSDQKYIAGFEKIGVPYLRDNRLDKGEWITYTTKGEVDEVAIVLSWRGGLYHIDGTGKDAGKIESTEWRARIRYRPAGSTGEWTEVKGPKPSSSNSVLSSIVSAVVSMTEKDDGWYRLSDGGWGTKRKKTSEFKMIARFRIGARSKIEVQIKGREEDTDRYHRVPTWIRVEEIQHEKRAYAGDALLGISLLAQPQLAGGLPRVTALVKGRKVYDPRTSSWGWSRNPALCVRDFLLDADNACGDWISSSDIADGSGESWQTVATACETNASATGDHKQEKHQLDLVIDVHHPAQQWLNHMLGTFRSTMIEYQGQIHLLQESAAASSRTYDARQTRASGNRPILALDDGRADISVREMNTDERPNVVKAQFHDRNQDYDRRWTDEVSDVGSDPEVRQELFLAGVTREAQALRQSRYVLNKSRLTPRRIDIGVGIGDLDMLPTEVITVYADSPPYDGELMLVEAISIRDGHTGMLHCREYDADVYDDTTDTLPAAPSWLSKADAIKKYRTPASGAEAIKLSEVA